MHGRIQRGKRLIAGGAGFIGSNLARDFIQAGIAVDVVDDLSTGGIENIAELRNSPYFRFIKADVADGEICNRLLRRQYSQVYHLACPTGVPNIELLGENMLLASSAGTLNLLRIAERSGATFLFASTAEAYGDPEVFPQPETYVGNVDPVGPRSPYEEGKRYGEALTRYYGRKHGIETRIVRIFNTYGSGMSPHDRRVIPQMLTRLIRGEPVIIYGDGSQTRTFLHVSDLVRGFCRVMDHGTSGEVYNIGGSSQITMRGLFKTIKAATGLRGRVRYKKHFIADHRGRWPDTSKVQALGWWQEVGLEEGIRRTYNDFLAAVDAPREGGQFEVASLRSVNEGTTSLPRSLKQPTSP